MKKRTGRLKPNTGRFVKSFRKGLKDIHAAIPDRKSVKASFGTVTFRRGTYSAAAIVLVIVIAVIVNMIAGKLPENIKTIDISSSKVYEISDTSKELLKSLDEDVKLTVFAEEDSMNDMLRTFLKKYTALTDKLSMEMIDPVLHPSSLEEYDTETDTIVVECEKTGLSQIVSFSDILVQDSYSYYYSGSSSISAFDGDGQLTSAVSKVIGQETGKAYYVSGHGESELPSAVTELMSKSGIDTEELNLFMKGTIPEDCDLLIFNGPSSDISNKERKAVNKYIKNGGSVIMLMAEKTPESGNLAKLMAAYKIELQQGYVADMERNYQGQYYMIIPQITDSGEVTGNLQNGTVLVNNSRAFDLGESSDEISVMSLMETSGSGFLVSEDSQEQGTFVIGAAASYTSASADSSTDADGDSDTGDGADTDSSEVKTGNLVVFGAASLIDESLTGSFSNLDNKSMFMNAISSVTGNTQSTAVEAKSLQVQYNTVQHGGIISAVIIFVIPAAFLIFGFIVWYRRRKA